MTPTAKAIIDWFEENGGSIGPHPLAAILRKKGFDRDTMHTAFQELLASAKITLDENLDITLGVGAKPEGKRHYYSEAEDAAEEITNKLREKEIADKECDCGAEPYKDAGAIRGGVHLPDCPAAEVPEHWALQNEKLKGDLNRLANENELLIARIAELERTGPEHWATQNASLKEKLRYYLRGVERDISHWDILCNDKDRLTAKIARLEAAIKPFLDFIPEEALKGMPPDMPLTAGSRLARAQLTASDFAALHAAVKEEG